ncbi:MAG: DUF4347 domain-containing protein, partial [Thiotrichales bacterium]
MKKQKHAPQKPYRRPQLEELEPRILYSADLLPGIEPEHAPIHRMLEIETPPAPSPTVNAGDELFSLDDIEVSYIDAHGNTLSAEQYAALGTPASPEEVTRPPTEIVFVDTGAENHEQLLADLLEREDAHYRVFILEAQIPGFAQIHAVINQFEQVDAIHFITHGAAGAIKLGSTWVQAHELENFQSDFERIRAALNDDADLLFYGCNVAANDAGQAMLAQIAAWTGADVAAS